ncbi:hypothetical protein [Candidatus Darwinibacter acetoxidans]
MRARWLIVVVVLLTAAALSGCLPKDTIKIENELSKLTDRFIEHLEAEELPELEVLFADHILLYPGRYRLENLVWNMEYLAEFLTEDWLPGLDELDPAEELWGGELLEEMLVKYEQDPNDPALEDLAAAAAERIALGHFFHGLTRADDQVVATWLDESSFSLDGITAPKVVLAGWFVFVYDLGITYEIMGRTGPFETGGRWYVVLDVVEHQPWDDWTYEFVLGFSKAGNMWLIDFFRVIYD